MGLNNFTGNPSNPTGAGGSSGLPPSGSASMASAMLSPVDIDDLLINYNKKFATAGTILFRDEIIHQVLGTLIGKNKPNALLIGQAGVGKTKIAEAIAFMLASKSPIIPDRLAGSVVYELPLSNIVSGSSFVGQVEEKIKAVIDFVCDKSNQAILFIDEIHQLVGDSSSYEKIAQILKPALARGDMRVIGATTLQEAGKLMDDPALNRRFSRIIVDEFTKEQTVEILMQARAGFFKHYSNKISIADELMETVVALADEYRPAGSHRPDNALTLLDRSIGDAIVARKLMEQQAQSDPALLQAIQSVPMIPITEKQVRKTAIRLMTGNAKKNDFDMDRMRTALSAIQGQDQVIEKLLQLLRQNDLALFPKTVPLTILFAGSSGVGKTEVTKIIARELTGMKPITLNMTEYHSPASINRIIGAPAGYVGSDSNAELPFDCLESNPYQVILLDEFEKGDRSVQRLFMSAFDEGYIKTAKGKLIDFSRCIIIATTNAGQKERKHSLGFGTRSASEPNTADDIKNLSLHFDTELLNRFQSIMTFNELSKDTYRNILVDIYHKEIARIRADKPRIILLDDIPDDKLAAMVDETYVPAFGARPARKTVREFIESQV